jgi:hypothetical protein
MKIIRQQSQANVLLTKGEKEDGRQKSTDMSPLWGGYEKMESSHCVYLAQ